MEKALANQHRPAYTLRLYSYDLAKEAASMAGTLVRDMTEGSPTRRIVEFFFPLLFGLLFQQVYNMVDTIVVGKFLGVKALACGEIEQKRLPVDGTYDDNGSSITIDAAANAQALREFIYG